MDCTVWPANAGYLKEVLDAAATILNMSCHNLLHVQCPLLQTQTTLPATIKHKRSLEDNLINRALDISRQITLSWLKDSNPAQDKRSATQTVYAAGHVRFATGVWKDSNAINNGIICNLPLIRVNEMIGYDPENKPGPSMRAEQMLEFKNVRPCVLFTVLSVT